MLSFTLFMNASIPAGSVTFICFLQVNNMGRKEKKKKNHNFHVGFIYIYL